VCEYFFMAFWVSIGFVNERSGAALGLFRGESLQAVRCWWCLLPGLWVSWWSAAGCVDRVLSVMP
jgi:hypothetical protein